jgi:O-antigen ligase
MQKIIFYALLVFIVLTPLPFGSNIPIAWPLSATIVALLTLLWAAGSIRSPQRVSLSLSPWIMLLFLVPCLWALLQVATFLPAGWSHPLWQLAGETLQCPLAGSISLNPDKTLTSFMRLLTYGLVFFLCFQSGRNRGNARIAIKWIAASGILYALYGLIIYWGDFGLVLLHKNLSSLHNVTSTFINRNSYATFAGMTLICTVALFIETITRPLPGMGGFMPGRQQRIEQYVVQSWHQLLGIMLLTVALISTHSRGGFISTAVAMLVLLTIFAGKSRFNIKALTAAIAGVLVVTFTAYLISNALLLKRLDEISLESNIRIAVYENTVEAIRDNPLLGFGYGSFKQGYRLYHHDDIPGLFHRAHNTYLENIFELGIPAATLLFLSILGVAITLFRGLLYRRRDWLYPAIGLTVTLQVAIHSLVDFSLQIPAVAITYASITGIAAAQSFSSKK